MTAPLRARSLLPVLLGAAPLPRAEGRRRLGVEARSLPRRLTAEGTVACRAATTAT